MKGYYGNLSARGFGNIVLESSGWEDMISVWDACPKMLCFVGIIEGPL